MDEQTQSLQELRHIKKMMERSSRFISLSGLSGISAGVCAMAGAWFGVKKFVEFKEKANHNPFNILEAKKELASQFFIIGMIVFIVAFILALGFTWVRSKKNNDSMWRAPTLRLIWNTILPIATGGLFIVRCMQLHEYLLIAPACLIFYGLALVNASKYTLREVRYLGYIEILLGAINLWILDHGLIFWAAGFGLLHILYGGLMWWKYERKLTAEQL